MLKKKLFKCKIKGILANLKFKAINLREMFLQTEQPIVETATVVEKEGYPGLEAHSYPSHEAVGSCPGVPSGGSTM